MGRPPTLSGDLVSVSVHGKGASWCGGHFVGAPEITQAARTAARLELPVNIGRSTYTAGADEPLAALAALVSYSSQARIVDIPADVAAELAADAEHPAGTWGIDAPAGNDVP